MAPASCQISRAAATTAQTARAQTARASWLPASLGLGSGIGAESGRSWPGPWSAATSARERPDAVVAATGSELHLAVAARAALAADGKKLNVVSIPCLEIYQEQDPAYRMQLLPRGVPTATIEAGITEPWKAVAGRDALTIGIDRFGASAPGSEVARQFGLSSDEVTARIREWLG